MKPWFPVRGYPKNLVETEMKEVKFTSKSKNNKTDKSLTVVPFVMNYHLNLRQLTKLKVGSA